MTRWQRCCERTARAACTVTRRRSVGIRSSGSSTKRCLASTSCGAWTWICGSSSRWVARLQRGGGKCCGITHDADSCVHRTGSLRHLLRHGHVACSFRPVRLRANRCKFELAAVSRGVLCTRAFTSAFKPRFRYYYAWSDSKAHIGSSFDVALRLSRDVFPASSSHMALLSPGVAYTPILPAVLILQPFPPF